MRIEADKNGHVVLKEILDDILIETAGGDQIGIREKDDTFEIMVLPKGASCYYWQRVNMQTRKMEAIPTLWSAP